jgi:putative two-component system response regulator
MHTHPILGEEICHPLKSLQDVCPIIRHHHEKWNGTGYPDGLMEDSIPYLARVFQIIDAYDALSSERPYKVAFPKDESLRILQDEASKGYWDKDILEKFISFIRCNHRR